jgi:16S rRNA G966 N2-methylase RsmD
MKFLTLFYYGLRSLLLRGPVNSLRIYKQEKQGDLFYGINTRDFVLQSAAGAHHYQGASYFVLDKLFNQLNLGRLPKQFFDIGCGLGRVLIVASAKGFKPCIGIDINAALVNSARENIATGKKNNALVLVERADATEYSYPKEAQVYFLFNPFDETVLERTLLRIKECATERNYFLYMNPVHKRVFDNLGYIALQRITTGFYTEAILYVSA